VFCVAALAGEADCAIAQVGAAGGDTAVIVAEPGDVRGRARAAQARFEGARERYFPLAFAPGGRSCDEVVGRLCVWYGEGEWIPVPEPDGARALRRELLAELDSLQQLAPGDGWILGQRVWYRGEGGEWAAALAAARTCGPVEPWWCSALEGLALHGLGRVPEAEAAFERALALMDPEQAVRWRVPDYVLDDDARSWLRALEREGVAELERGLERLWLLADPLYLVEGNDRLTAHYARWTVATLREGARSPFRLRWGSDLEELVVRHGWEIGWERSWGRQLGSPFEVTGHKHPDAREYMPSGRALALPAATGSHAFIADGRVPRSLHAPSYAPVLLPMEGQVAFFPRGERVAVVGTAFLPEDTSFHANHDHPRPWMEPGDQEGLADRVGLFVMPLDGGAAIERRAFGSTEGALLVEVARGAYVVSVESWSPARRRAGRMRFGVEHRRAPPEVATLSDLLLLHGQRGTPASLEAALPAALPRAEARAKEPLAVAWEVSGLGLRPERLGFTISVKRLDRSVFRRLWELLGLRARTPALALSWEEPGPAHPVHHFRHVDLDLGDLEPGRYEITLSLATVGRTEAVTRRTLRIVAP
jgi:hypothetical protein